MAAVKPIAKMIKKLVFMASLLVWFGIDLHAQPVITNQPASQTNLAGTTVSFTVAASGIGPFTYQWQFSGTNIPNNIITTVAGNGTNGYSGNGGAATNAQLNGPWDVAFDAIGNLYIADRSNFRVRMVGTNGIISTVAGGGFGNLNYSGAATNASLDPIGMAFDPTGNLFISDRANHCIRKVTTNGIISTVAGGGANYPGNGGAATNASLANTFGVICDAFGNLYFTGDNGLLIRKVDTNGIITTVAGNGISGYSGDGGSATNASLNVPSFLAFDVSGNLYIADSGNNVIRKVSTSGIVTTVAGNGVLGYSGDGGTATNASLNNPESLAFDPFGSMYISDSHNGLIRKVDTNGIITTVAGGGSFVGAGGAATNAALSPNGVTCDVSGNFYIAESGLFYDRVRKVLFAGNPTLTLLQVGAANAGNYTVIVTSPYGSVTSVLATLTVTIPSTPPQIGGGGTLLGSLTNQFGFNINAAFGQTIVVNGSTDLVNWTPLFTNIVGNSTVPFVDPSSSNYPARFYRARLQ